MKQRISILIFVLVMLLSSLAFSAVPVQINYQGILTDTAGIPLANTSKLVQFRIYDDPSAGNVKWSETRTVSTDGNGRFNVNLGEDTPIDDTVFNDTVRYLGIKVDVDAELTPRTRIVSVGYSNRVGTVDGASGGIISGDVSIQSNLTVSDTVKATGAGVEFPDGSVLTTGLIVPIGAVIAWLKTFANTPALPSNFVECNGAVLNDPQSPYDGQTIPNLNSFQYFLRGQPTSGTIGGTTSHNHSLSGTTDNIFSVLDANRFYNNSSSSFSSSHLPPYYTVVWIIRVK